MLDMYASAVFLLGDPNRPLVLFTVGGVIVGAGPTLPQAVSDAEETHIDDENVQKIVFTLKEVGIV
jgi:hypothetical protein